MANCEHNWKEIVSLNRDTDEDPLFPSLLDSLEIFFYCSKCLEIRNKRVLTNEEENRRAKIQIDKMIERGERANKN